MALILEDSQEVTKKSIQIPKNAKEIFKAMAQVYEPYLDTVEGGKILKSYSKDKTYNKKGTGNEKVNGKKDAPSSVGVDVAKMRLSRQNKFAPNTIQYQLYGGELANNILRKGIETARTTQTVDKVKPPKPTSAADIKPTKPEVKTIDTPNGQISYKVNEGADNSRPVFFDYLEDYDVWYVLDEFIGRTTETQNWSPLIKPNMYQKALQEFTKYGFLKDFPKDIVYKWMGIIMKNAAILQANTELAGHTTFFPIDDVTDWMENSLGLEDIDVDNDYNISYTDKNGKKETVNVYDYLDNIGFYDWLLMPDGSSAWSDFGLEPLFNIFQEYNSELPAEDVLVLVNRCLDIAHMRGDLSSIFIEGGRQTLSRISEEITKQTNKTVILREEQIIRLKNSFNHYGI